jgi:hypothetical protein
MFEKLTLEASLYIARHMRSADRECLRNMIGEFGDESFAINRHHTQGAAWAFWQGGVPVVMGGIAETTEWSAEAWMVSVEVVSCDSWKKIIRFSRKVFTNASFKYSRIEAHVLETWPQAKKYASQVGFRHVSTKERAGRNGESVLEFAILGAKNNE